VTVKLVTHFEVIDFAFTFYGKAYVEITVTRRKRWPLNVLCRKCYVSLLLNLIPTSFQIAYA